METFRTSNPLAPILCPICHLYKNKSTKDILIQKVMLCMYMSSSTTIKSDKILLTGMDIEIEGEVEVIAIGSLAFEVAEELGVVNETYFWTGGTDEEPRGGKLAVIDPEITPEQVSKIEEKDRGNVTGPD